MTAGPSTVGPGEHCNRRVVAVLAAAVLAAVAAPVASAHVGELKTVVKAGPYRLVVRALPIQAGTQSALTFRASITDSLTGAAVSGARVRVLVRAPAGTISGPYRTAAVRRDLQRAAPDLESRHVAAAPVPDRGRRAARGSHRPLRTSQPVHAMAVRAAGSSPARLLPLHCSCKGSFAFGAAGGATTLHGGDSCCSP